MQYMRKLYDGNKCIEINVKWLDGSTTAYPNPDDDLITMFELLCDYLVYNNDTEYNVIMPSLYREYEDGDMWCVVLTNENYYQKS